MTRGTALITGGTRGIGLELCRAAQTLGYHVVTCSRNSVGDDFPFHHEVCDLNDPASIERLVSAAAAAGPIRLLVNNAGAIIAVDGLDSETSENVSQTFELNVFAPLALTRAVYPQMKNVGGGLVINMTSIYGGLASPYVISYAATKAALLNITKSLAVALAPFAIRVNSISPGNIDTEMTRSAGADYIGEVTERTPVKRLGLASEVARVLGFLSDAEFITGEDVVIDGGIGLVGG